MAAIISLATISGCAKLAGAPIGSSGGSPDARFLNRGGALLPILDLINRTPDRFGA